VSLQNLKDALFKDFFARREQQNFNMKNDLNNSERRK
jgi:hypothetical protein